MSNEKQTPTIMYNDTNNNFRIEKSVYEIPDWKRAGEKLNLVTFVRKKSKFSKEFNSIVDYEQRMNIPLNVFNTFVETIKNSK